MNSSRLKCLILKLFLKKLPLFLLLFFISMYLLCDDPDNVSISSAMHYFVHDIILPYLGQKVFEYVYKALK